MSKTIPCPICNGPKRGVPVPEMGELLEGWQQVYHGPEGHTISHKDAKTGERTIYPMSCVCADCIAQLSEADWTGKRFMLKSEWDTTGDDAFQAAGDALMAGHTMEESARIAGISTSTLYRMRKAAKEKLAKMKDS